MTNIFDKIHFLKQLLDQEEKEHYPTLREIRDKLEFNVNLKDQTAIKGSTAKFICSCIGKVADMRFYRGTKEVEYGSRFKNLSEPKDGFACLEITGLEAEDSGIYTCYAKNAVERISTSCFLKVVERVEMKKHDDGMAPLFVRHIKG